MSLSQTVAPTVDPVTLAEAKDQCRIDGTDEDTLLGVLIKAAWRYCERAARKQLITATWVQTFDGWPPHAAVEEFLGSSIILLRNPPLQLVSSVKYRDAAGVEQTMSSDDYTQDTAAVPGRIVLGHAKTWPTNRGHTDDIEITYKAGYGDATTDVPDTIRQAILMLVGHLYENREASVSGAPISKAPFAVDALLSIERDYGFL